jgi:excinuclease ABC subunit C
MPAPPTFDHTRRLAEMPTEPGVYLMRTHDGQIIYVGKAKSLRARLKQYFSGHDTRPFVAKLPTLLADIDVILTRTEKEALILEANLIRQHQPRFNVALRGDSAHLLLRIDPQTPWPRVEITRRRRKDPKDTAHYFGPYHSASGLRDTLRVLNRHFMLRTCTDAVLATRKRPCLQYQIKRCPAPCVLPVDRPQYLANAQEATLFLRGRRLALIDQLTARMTAAADALAFEQAASLRDQIASVRQVIERQQVVLHEDIDQDIFALHTEQAHTVVHLLTVREGRLQGSQPFHLGDTSTLDPADAFAQALSQYYADPLSIPDEVLLSHDLPPDDALTIAAHLRDLKGKKVPLKVPKAGPRFEAIEAALRNAAHQAKLYLGGVARTQSLLDSLQKALDLSRPPARIECYDISNLQDTAIVASQVVFIDAQPAKSAYKTYKIRQDAQDDFAAMHEVISRRFRHVAEGDEDPPDLVIIDGGPGQLAAAASALSDLGLLDAFDIIGLAKARTLAGEAVGPVARSEERVFKPDAAEPITLPQHAPEVHLLQRVRDETHRTAVGFHRKVRDRDTLKSSLDDIPSVGPSRKRALLTRFGSVKAIRNASPHDIAQLPGFSLPLAEKILEALKPSDLDISAHDI